MRSAVLHATAELIRVRAELEAVSRLLGRAHNFAGSDVKTYREGDLYCALALAGDSVTEALDLVGRFLDLQVVGLRDPIPTLRSLDEERGTDRSI